MQWYKTPYVFANATDTAGNIDLSVSPDGDLYWLAYLPAGSHSGGAFTIATPGYYIVQYNASGTYQQHIRPAFSSSVPLQQHSGDLKRINLIRDHTTGRFYLACNHDQTALGTLTIGANIYPQPMKPTAFLSCFDAGGAALWTRKSDTGKRMHIVNPVLGNNVVYIGGFADTGSVFAGDTAKNTLYLMALDTAGSLIWSSYGGNSNASYSGGVSHIAYANNILLAVGSYSAPSLTWGIYTVSTSVITTSNTFAARINAANGTAISLDSLNASLWCYAYRCAIDKNSNIYVGGIFRNRLPFAGSTLISSDTLNSGDMFVARFKNVNCNCDLPRPAFIVTQTGATSFSFNYTGTTPYTSISWSFGDGSPAVVGNPNASHSYTGFGTFPVCVTVTNGCGENTTCHYVSIPKPNHVKTANGFSIAAVYPNPANGILFIDGAEAGTKATVYDVMGRLLLHTILKEDKESIDVSTLHSGVYLLRLTDKSGNTENKQFIKE